MAILPPFTTEGLLPPGDFELSFDEVRRSHLVSGAAGTVISTHWDRAWRLRLVDNLEILTLQFWEVGIRDIYVDGSFAEDKDHPNDIDGYFVCDFESLKSERLQWELNRLDPDQIWTWNPATRRPYRGYPKKQLPMWHKYRVELYPHAPLVGLTSGIRDRHGHELEFPAAFRQSRRDGSPRGIVKIRYGGPS